MAAAESWYAWASRRWSDLSEGHRKRLMDEAEKEFKTLLEEDEANGKVQSEDGSVQSGLRIPPPGGQLERREAGGVQE